MRLNLMVYRILGEEQNEDGVVETLTEKLAGWDSARYVGDNDFANGCEKAWKEDCEKDLWRPKDFSQARALVEEVFGDTEGGRGFAFNQALGRMEADGDLYFHESR